jgi:soluble lytic murein transglycosylase-like protein
METPCFFTGDGRMRLIPFLVAISLFSLPGIATAKTKTRHGKEKKSAASPLPALPKPLEDFLGPPPPGFRERFLKPADSLRAAMEAKAAGKSQAAIGALSRLGESELAEHSGFELANLLREQGEFSRSSSAAEKVLREFPGSTYADRLRDLLEQNECDSGLREAKVAKTGPRLESAAHLLRLCLARAPWKEWEKHEAQATALYELLKNRKDPLLAPYLAELIQALPPSSALRRRMISEIPNEKLEEYASLARFHTKSSGASGVKAVYPDAELFDSGMKAVLKKQWAEANVIFKRLPAEFPQSEHWDRAQFWIARTEDKLGHPEEAEKRCVQIQSESPLSYYGLQCALRLKKDLSAYLADSSPAGKDPVSFTGTPTTRQALSLWRLRALLSNGLIEQAREEARFLFQLKAGGSTIGQESPAGALMMAELFRAADFHLAAFSHAYAALSLDPAFLNAHSLSFLFPRVYEKEYAAAAELSGVNPLLLYSVTKQESGFLPNAISHSDALGLMQLLYPTAQGVIPGISRKELFLPERNIQAGARFLHQLLDRFQGNIALTLAGYNAGPTRAAQWQKAMAEAPAMQEGFDPDIFIDTIPITETRKYVGSILRNYAWYKLLAKDGTIKSAQELNFQWQRNKIKPENPPAQPPAAVEPAPTQANPPAPPPAQPEAPPPPENKLETKPESRIPPAAT